MASRSRFRSVQLEHCSEVIYEPILKDATAKGTNQMKPNSMSDSALPNHASGGGCCCPTTSTAPLAAASASSNTVITVISRPKNRGIVHSITENGTARLVFEDNFTRLKGVLLNRDEESFSIAGTSAASSDSQVDPVAALQDSLAAGCLNGEAQNSDRKSSPSRTTCRLMTINVVDADVGQTFCVEAVEVKITARLASGIMSTDVHQLAAAGNWGSIQLGVEINHPAIRFRTDEVFIGNKAEIEMRKYLGVDANRLARINSRSGVHHNHHSSMPTTPSAVPLQAGLTLPSPAAMYVGTMALNIVSLERTAPSMRRVSTCDGCATNIIEQANDFLV